MADWVDGLVEAHLKLAQWVTKFPEVACHHMMMDIRAEEDAAYIKTVFDILAADVRAKKEEYARRSTSKTTKT